MVRAGFGTVPGSVAFALALETWLLSDVTSTNLLGHDPDAALRTGSVRRLLQVEATAVALVIGVPCAVIGRAQRAGGGRCGWRGRRSTGPDPAVRGDRARIHPGGRAALPRPQPRVAVDPSPPVVEDGALGRADHGAVPAHRAADHRAHHSRVRPGPARHRCTPHGFCSPDHGAGPRRGLRVADQPDGVLGGPRIADRLAHRPREPAWCASWRTEAGRGPGGPRPPRPAGQRARRCCGAANAAFAASGEAKAALAAPLEPQPAPRAAMRPRWSSSCSTGAP